MDAQMMQTIYMDLIDELSRVLEPFLRRLQTSMILRFVLWLCWCILHLLVEIVHVGLCLIHLCRCYIMSAGLLEKYWNLDLSKLRYLAIVVDSEEAKNSAMIRQLLHWLATIGVKHVILYDLEGVLKKSMETDVMNFCHSSSLCYGIGGTKIFQEKLAIELLSFSDSKEGMAKAASLLCSKYLQDDPLGPKMMEPIFTEADISNALKAVGCGGPDPDLILVYGPARCHFGFPAWRIRYTEIVYIGPLRSMRYGIIVKAIYDFSKKHQNYGS